jgi:RimJ/RimL family protein N-acetyltransferase
MADSDIPILRTGRLTLRAFRAADLDDYAGIRADPAVARYIGGPHDRGGARDRIAVMVGQWRLRGYGVLAVEEDATGRVIGHAGLLHPIDWPEPEIAYSLSPARWGRGFATEAARAVRDWAFATHPFPRLASFIAPDNVRSIRVAEKLGAAPEGAFRLRGVEVVLWAHRRPETGPPLPTR